MKRIAPWLAGLLLSCPLSAAPPLEIEEAWIRAAPPTARVLAGYLTIANPGDRDARVTGIRGADFARAELHETRVEDGVARMLPVPELTVPAGGRVRMEPGGLHVMLFEPVRPLAPGESVRLELLHEGQAAIAVEARVVRDPGDGEGHGHHHHQHHQH